MFFLFFIIFLSMPQFAGLEHNICFFSKKFPQFQKNKQRVLSRSLQN